jgi:hypothetical protein
MRSSYEEGQIEGREGSGPSRSHREGSPTSGTQGSHPSLCALAYTGQGWSDRGKGHVDPLMPQAEFDSSRSQQFTKRRTRQGGSARTILCWGLSGVWSFCWGGKC